ASCGTARSIFWSTYNEGMRALLLGLFCCALLSASAMQLRDPLVDPGWQHFYNNEYDQALAAFEQEAHEHPKDPAAYNHIAQAVLYREMFRSGALESQLVTGNNPFLRRAKMNVPPEVKKQFQDALHKAIDLGNAELNREDKNIPALYALSVAHGLQANYAFLVEKAWTQALREATASRKYSDRISRSIRTLWMRTWSRGCTIMLWAACRSISACSASSRGFTETAILASRNCRRWRS